MEEERREQVPGGGGSGGAAVEATGSLRAGSDAPPVPPAKPEASGGRAGPPRGNGRKGSGDAPGCRRTSGRRHSPEERRRAVEAFRASGQDGRTFAKLWGVSYMSLYKWAQRYRDLGPKGLERLTDGPPKRRGRPPLPAPVREEIAAVKRRFPDFGLRKVRDFLVRFVGVRVSAGSVQKTLRDEGLPPGAASPRRRRRRPGPPRRFERARPGELWQSDITYLYLPGHREPLYLVAFLDDFSRYVVSFGLHTHQKAAIVIEALLEGIARFGKPQEVLTDQGRQYFAWRGRSEFEKLLLREGVKHVVARSHHPQTVGKCERFWETVKRELWDRVSPKDLLEARERLGHFIAHYNHFRPHQGLGRGVVPADRFFGAASEVREAIEKTITANELRLALGERPRKPAYLVGQIGDHLVSMHGEGGRVVIHTEDGRVEEIGLEELGMAGEKKKSRQEGGDDDDGACGGSVRSGGGGGDGGSGGAAARREEPGEAGAVRGAEACACPDEGALGGGDGGGAPEGARDGGGAAGGMGGTGDEGGGGAEALGAPGEGLAAQPAGGGGDGGGAAQAAQEPSRDAAGPAAASGGGSAVAAEADRGARGGAAGGAEPDRDPAGDAGAEAGAGDAGAEARQGEEPCSREPGQAESGSEGSART